MEDLVRKLQTKDKTTQYLSLAHNGLEELPAIITSFQKLKTLDLSYNKFKVLPPQVLALQNLRLLILNNNRLEDLPDTLGQLQSLETIMIHANPLEGFPRGLLQLNKLHTLALTRCPKVEIPEDIDKLQNLEKLYLGNSAIKTLPKSLANLPKLGLLDIQSHKIRQVFSTFLFLAHLNPQKARLLDPMLFGINVGTMQKIIRMVAKLSKINAPLSLRKYAFDILTQKTIPIDRKLLFDLLCINYPPLNNKVWTLIADNNNHTLAKQPLDKNSVVCIVGRPKALKKTATYERLNKLGIQYTQKLNTTTTHALVVAPIPLKHKVHNYPNLVFISEQDLHQFLQEQEGGFLLEQDKETIQNRGNLIELLYSTQEESIRLAVQLIEGGGLDKSLITPLFIAYTFVQDKTLRKKIRQLLYVNIDKGGQELLRGRISFYTTSMRESEICNRLIRYQKATASLDISQVAQFVYKNHQKAYTYLILHAPAKQQTAFLQLFINSQHILDCSKLSRLGNLPTTLKEFPDLMGINMQGCSIRQFPKILLDYPFKKLKWVDLRKTNVRKLPYPLPPHLEDCKFFTNF
ncbi:MAG: leucine-rich repeat domain-containing protein [Aureispira sp.]|nr:leucine-rich repeat domain-containing protein [Aureispira sp.]